LTLKYNHTILVVKVDKPKHLHNMNKEQHDTEKSQAIREAAKILGRIGGMAGRGDSKRRPSEVCRAAVLKRWETYRKNKSLASQIKS
jgi:hypothetical protein